MLDQATIHSTSRTEYRRNWQVEGNKENRSTTFQAIVQVQKRVKYCTPCVNDLNQSSLLRQLGLSVLIKTTHWFNSFAKYLTPRKRVFRLGYEQREIVPKYNSLASGPITIIKFPTENRRNKASGLREPCFNWIYAARASPLARLI